MEKTPNSAWMSYHRVDTLLANSIHSWLATICVQAVSIGYNPLTLTISRDMVQDIYDYHQQMETGYMHPRSDSAKYRALKMNNDWKQIKNQI